jgi:hypothetical protein
VGIKGPIPDRSDQVVRRNIREPIDKIQAIGVVPIPDLGIPNAHPLAVDLYEAMRESAQSKYYEPTDWQMARLTMHVLSDMLHSKPSAMMLASVNTMLTALLLTEGDRRRVRLEVERNQEGAKVLDIAEMFRKKLEQG